jgi:small ligand-binding sensory domain FIST
MSEPRFAAALSTLHDLPQALREVCAAKAPLGGPPDLAFVFVSADRAEQFEEIAAALCDELGTENLLGCTGESLVGTGIGFAGRIEQRLGCTGESLVGTGREVEGETAISLWLARLPGTNIAPMHLQFEKSPDGALITGWPDDYAHAWPAGTALFCLGEPFSFPADWMLERLNEDRPGVPVIGGMASGAATPGENRLILGRRVYREGAVGVLVQGDIHIRTVLSQGCRPIGTHFVVTKAEQNVIFELGGRPALLVLKEIFDTLPTREQALVQNGVHLGRVVSEYQERFEPGDFRIRNVLGIDPAAGSVAVNDFIRPGQTVQFHVRDAETADEDLKQCLAAVKQDASQPLAGLLFTCNGRGMRLFREPHHDAGCVRDALGDIPLAGFFAQGELGPIGDKNFVHGFTASLALFEKHA